jgi:hypothetical protein
MVGLGIALIRAQPMRMIARNFNAAALAASTANMVL